jgi:carbamoyltransferase
MMLRFLFFIFLSSSIPTFSWISYSNEIPSLPEITSPTILAFSFGNKDSAACLIKKGELVAAVAEERFTRKKHDSCFPEKAIQYCLEVAGKQPIDIVVYSGIPKGRKEKIQKLFEKTTGLTHSIIYLNTHLCQAAGSYYMSGLNQAAIVSLNDDGDHTVVFGQGKDNVIHLEQCIPSPHSIGKLYTHITQFLGFKGNNHEYKVMGLASYGIMERDKNPFYSSLKKTFLFHQDGSISVNLPPFYCSETLSNLLQFPTRLESQPLSQKHKNLAASLQLVTEDAIFHILNHVQKITNEDNLCLSGDLALNGVINGKILSKTHFKTLSIQPAADSTGGVIGAAKYIQYRLDPLAPRELITHSSYGPEYSSDEILSFLENKEITYTSYSSPEEILTTAAMLLEKKNVIGWFQGRMEWGPRALGNRSILASPQYEEMKNILNAKVKQRELFRPFAPTICKEDISRFFYFDTPLPQPAQYMLCVYPIKETEHSNIPAVTHVDGTGRPQVLSEIQNPLFYKLIKQFETLTGLPILINTSFNLRGEPIVCSPEDAYHCMMGTEIDYLIIDRFLIKRTDNLKDSWIPTIND